jgi:hypothetical protein
MATSVAKRDDMVIHEGVVPGLDGANRGEERPGLAPLGIAVVTALGPASS